MTSPSVAQNIENWPIERLREYPRNPRKNDSAVDRMCASIREFGFKVPCLVRSDGEVVDGQALGLSGRFTPYVCRVDFIEGNGRLTGTMVVSNDPTLREECREV